ncbi:MAG TPA: hypothetical protein VFD82_17570 [Planctomycetota bacterium]|nr:hypothetical protein [Planctomycetota bacterium]
MRACPAIVVPTATLWLALGAQPQQPVEVQRIESPIGSVQRLHSPPDAPEPKYTLWVLYTHDPNDFLDHVQYLADLQRRFAERGIAVAVVMPAPAAKRAAARTPSFAVASIDEEKPVPQAGLVPDERVPSAMAALCRGGESVPLAWSALDGAVDLMQAVVEEKFESPVLQRMEETVQALLANVIDSGELAAEVEKCVAAWPRSGRVRAMAVLFQWWSRGDLEAAHKAFEGGVKALAGEGVPMVQFADLVLRGDRYDPRHAKTLAVLLGPLAAASPDGVFTQLVYLRALLRAGQDRIAGRTAAMLPKHLEGRPWDQLVFAETLMEANLPAAFRDLAEQAIEAVADGLDARLLCAVRHKVLVRCGDLEAAEKLMVEYRGKNENAFGLNNDAWYMMVQPLSLGRFDTMALAQCEEMQRQQGAGLSNGSKDTVALALFLNGQIQEAVELQTVAAAASGNDARYVGRLTRFQAVLAEQARKKGTEPKK